LEKTSLVSYKQLSIWSIAVLVIVVGTFFTYVVNNHDAKIDKLTTNVESMALIIERLTTLQSNTIDLQPKITILTENVNTLTLAVNRVVEIQNERQNLQKDLTNLISSNELAHRLIELKLTELEKKL